jgi:serine/threonine protein phosphatase PrpC
MHFELLDSFTLPGDPSKPNEDSFACGPRFACVFDGATVLGEHLMPGRSDAQWIAQFGARRLKAHVEAGAGGLRDGLRAAATDAEKSFGALRRRAPEEIYEIPFASLMALSLDGNALEGLWLGDCAALIRTPDGAIGILGETLAKRGRERERAQRMAGPKGGAASSVREKFLPALRALRNKDNAKGSDWLFAPDPRCADHADAARAAALPGSLVLLATDGFLALISDYEKYSPDTLLSAAEARGLAALGQELRAAEAADPEGKAYPRFKKSDDATALLLSLRA